MSNDPFFTQPNCDRCGGSPCGLGGYSVESLTGLNFFSVLPDAVETNLEAGVSILLMSDLHSP